MAEDWVVWLVLAGLLVIAEIFSGTFYLLMLAVGTAFGSAAAWWGADRPGQLLAAAIVGAAATLVLWKTRDRNPGGHDAASDPNVNMDVGQTVQVTHWNKEGAVPVTRVHYRGAMWDVELAREALAEPGTFIIREVRGSRLVVSNINQ